MEISMSSTNASHGFCREVKVHRFNIYNLVLVSFMGLLVFVIGHHLSQMNVNPVYEQHPSESRRELQSIQVEDAKKDEKPKSAEIKDFDNDLNPMNYTYDEELQYALMKQELLNAHELQHYLYSLGKSGMDARGLDDLLMDKGGQPIRNVIITSWRSGSTFLGDVLDSHPANYYHYEPLLHYEIVQIRGGERAQKAIRLIKNLLHCNYTGQDSYLQYGQYHVWLFLHNSRLWQQCQEHPLLCWEPSFLNPFCRLFPFQSMKLVRLRLYLTKHLLDDPSLNLRILYMVRDPRGTMQSRKHRDWCPGNPDCDDPRRLCTDLVSDYKAANRMRSKYKDRFRVIRYEDLSVEPYESVKDLFGFFGLYFHQYVKNFLDTHTKFNIGGVSSTFRDSRSVPFHWRKDLTYEEVKSIQAVCKSAMSLWGYAEAHNRTHQRFFNPVLDFKWNRNS